MRALASLSGVWPSEASSSSESLKAWKSLARRAAADTGALAWGPRMMTMPNRARWATRDRTTKKEKCRLLRAIQEIAAWRQFLWTGGAPTKSKRLGGLAVMQPSPEHTFYRHSPKADGAD